MSRFVPDEIPREGSRHYQRNLELGGSMAVKACERADGTPGVAILARRLMIVVSPDDAIEIADGLVDAVEAVSA